MSQRGCPDCGIVLENRTDNYCVHCGRNLKSLKSHCVNCNHGLHIWAAEKEIKYCPNCGKRFNPYRQEVPA